jgi:hypothetical protein
MVLVEILIQAPTACNKSVVGMQVWSHKGGKCRVKALGSVQSPNKGPEMR